MGGRTTTTRSRQYVPGTPSEVSEEGKNDARSEECIKAEGGGESNGALVGSSLATGLAVPAVAGIPYIGWFPSHDPSGNVISHVFELFINNP